MENKEPTFTLTDYQLATRYIEYRFREFYLTMDKDQADLLEWLRVKLGMREEHIIMFALILLKRQLEGKGLTE